MKHKYFNLPNSSSVESNYTQCKSFTTHGNALRLLHLTTLLITMSSRSIYQLHKIQLSGAGFSHTLSIITSQVNALQLHSLVGLRNWFNLKSTIDTSRYQPPKLARGGIILQNVLIPIQKQILRINRSNWRSCV